MKKLLISFAALALLAACSDDDDNNDVKQPEVLAKKITKIEKTEEGYEGKDTYTYTYTKEGKVATITEDEYDVTTFTYAKDKVTVKYEDDDEAVFTLDENGRVVKYTTDEDSWNTACTYNKDGYLTKTLTTYKEEDEKDDSEIEDFTYSKGCLEKYVYTSRWKEDEGEDKGKMKEDADVYEFTYGKQENKMNLDLFAVIANFSEWNEHYLCGIAGNRSVKLPETIKNTWTDEEKGKVVKVEATYTYTYTTDKDGYITEVKVVRESKKDGKVDKDEASTETYKITYEK